MVRRIQAAHQSIDPSRMGTPNNFRRGEVSHGGTGGHDAEASVRGILQCFRMFPWPADRLQVQLSRARDRSIPTSAAAIRTPCRQARQCTSSTHRPSRCRLHSPINLTFRRGCLGRLQHRTYGLEGNPHGAARLQVHHVRCHIGFGMRRENGRTRIATLLPCLAWMAAVLSLPTSVSRPADRYFEVLSEGCLSNHLDGAYSVRSSMTHCIPGSIFIGKCFQSLLTPPPG